MVKKFVKIQYGGKKLLGFKKIKKSNLSQRSFIKEINGEPHFIYEMKRGNKIIKKHQEKMFKEDIRDKKLTNKLR